MDLLKWRVEETRYTCYEAGYLGEYVAFIVEHDEGYHGGDTDKYNLKCKLSGLRGTCRSFRSKQQDMYAAEQVLSVWMSKSGLTNK